MLRSPALLLLLLVGCSAPPPAPPTPTRLAVVTTSFPADWLVQRLADGLVDRRNVNPPGEDPGHWQPSGDVVAAAASADLIVANGAGFEAWMATATLPASRVVGSADGVEPITIKGSTHSHGKAGEHSHAGLDPHTWTDPVGYAQQAAVVAARLTAADPGHAADYAAALASLQADLEALDGRLQVALAPARTAAIATNHPAFNYLARRYGLTLSNYDFDPEAAPGAEALAAFEGWRAGRAVTLWWEEEPSQSARAAFDPAVRHVLVDPLEGPGEGGYDYLDQARANIARFEAWLKPEGP